MKKLLITSGIVAGILSMATPAFASTYDGSLHINLATGIEGVVVVAPTASPASGTYTGTQNVTLSASGSNSIHYFLNTIDLDNALTCSSGATYSSPIEIAGSGLLRAVACYGTKASPVAKFSYVISTATTPAPAAGGGGGGGGGGGSVSPTTTTTPATTTTVGDITADGSVDVLDFNALLVQWGKTGASLSADLDHNDIVDIFDFNTLIIHLAS